MTTYEIEFHKVSSLPLIKENYRGHVFFNDATNEPIVTDKEGNKKLQNERGIYLCAYDEKGNLSYIPYTVAGAGDNNTGIDVDTLNDRITLWASKFQNDIQKLAKLTVDPDQITAQVKEFRNELNELDDKVAKLRIESNQINLNVEERVEGVRQQCSQLKIEADKINLNVENLDSEIDSRISQAADNIRLEVSHKTSSASILAQINDDTSEVKIKADKIQLGGIEIRENSIASSNNNFSVTNEGVLTTTSGSIGGIIIGTNSISSDNGNFSVTDQGALTANNATITGTITATSGSIGGIIINENSIASDNGNFSVTKEGVLTANDAKLTGSLTVTRDINGVNKSYDIGDYVIGKINEETGKFDMSETVSGAIAALNEEIYGPALTAKEKEGVDAGGVEKDKALKAYNERVMKSNTLLGRVLRAEGKILALQNDIKALQNVIEILKTNTSTEDTKIDLGGNKVSIAEVVTFSCPVCGEKFLYGKDVNYDETHTYGEMDSIVCPTCGAIAYKGLTVAPKDNGSSDSGSESGSGSGSTGGGSGSGSGGGGIIGDSGSILDKGNTRPTLPTFDLSQNADITIQ